MPRKTYQSRSGNKKNFMKSQSTNYKFQITIYKCGCPGKHLSWDPGNTKHSWNPQSRWFYSAPASGSQRSLSKVGKTRLCKVFGVTMFSGLSFSWITVVNVVVSVDYKWIFVIVVHRHQHVGAGPANHNWGLLAQAQTRVIAVQSPGHIWCANTFNVVQTGGCIFLSARLSLPRTVFNVNPDTHIESLESSEKHVVEGTSKWSCKIKVSGKNVVPVSF